jgi:hypothetical protein
MTDRNEPELDWTFEARFESLADRRIREAMEAGQFDDLPGAGKPIPDLAEPHDELWWVRKWLARNDVPAADLRGLKRRRPPAR